MTRLLFTAVAFVVMAILYPPVITQAKVAAINPCLNESAQITVTFNSTESDVGAIKNRFDDKIAEIEKTAKEAGIEEFAVQSMNYNVHPQNYNAMGNAQYVFSGNVSFRVSPASKALELMSVLIKKGFAASANVNSYNNGGANCNTLATPAPVE